MTAIKIYYKGVPGLNLVSNKDGTKIWSRNIDIDLVNKNTVLPLFDLLGVEYTFSTDSDAVPIIDVGSIDIRSENMIKICNCMSQRFKKAIIWSTQEPWQSNTVVELLERFPNLFFVDSSTPLENGAVFHERYANFPAFLCRHLSPRLHITLSPGDDITYRKQKIMYSCLLARWRIEKHLLFSMLHYSDLIKNNFVTYRSLFEAEDEQLVIPSMNTAEKLRGYEQVVDMLMPNTPYIFKNYIKEGLTNFSPLSLPNDINVDNAPTITPKEQPIAWHSPIIRGQPKFIFEDSLFSVICESFSGSQYKIGYNGNYVHIDSRSYITEKSIVPIMNGHPWLVFGEVGFYDTMQSYGFVAHDELFDLSFDSDTHHDTRLYGVEKNLLNLEFDFVLEQLRRLTSVTHKKIRHNRYNIFNTNSEMWKQLRKDMSLILERFNDLDV